MIPWLERDTPFPPVQSALKDPNGLLAAGADLSCERLIEAYRSLHRLGYAHSVETWIDGDLAGGLYGVAIGRVFFGESMFSRARDASKIALAGLVTHLTSAGFGLIDCQMRTRHLESLGAREITRRRFSRLLEELIHYPHSPGSWSGAAQVPCRS